MNGHISMTFISLNPCFSGNLVQTERSRAQLGLLRCSPKAAKLTEMLCESTLIVMKITRVIGLNPCFNGRCSVRRQVREHGHSVDGLNPCFNGRCSVSAT